MVTSVIPPITVRRPLAARTLIHTLVHPHAHADAHAAHAALTARAARRVAARAPRRRPDRLSGGLSTGCLRAVWPSAGRPHVSRRCRRRAVCCGAPPLRHCHCCRGHSAAHAARAARRVAARAPRRRSDRLSGGLSGGLSTGCLAIGWPTTRHPEVSETGCLLWCAAIAPLPLLPRPQCRARRARRSPRRRACAQTAVRQAVRRAVWQTAGRPRVTRRGDGLSAAMRRHCATAAVATLSVCRAAAACSPPPRAWTAYGRAVQAATWLAGAVQTARLTARLTASRTAGTLT